MCLRFVFLLITRTASWLRLSRREETWRITEILILRHQLAVLQRRQPQRPKLNWADRSMRGRPGRPATRLNIKTLVLRLARENPDYDGPAVPVREQLDLEPGRCTWRVPCSIKNKTYRRRRNAVSTWKKSVARIVVA
jgi:hypothetical protein